MKTTLPPGTKTTLPPGSGVQPVWAATSSIRPISQIGPIVPLPDTNSGR